MKVRHVGRICALFLTIVASIGWTQAAEAQTVITGKVTDAEASALYRSADCFIMPSVSEPFGLVALEAAAHGVPVIVSKQSGVSEVLRHGFAVDFWDADKSADCIVTILREKALATQLRSEAPKIAQQLTWKNQANIVTSIYREVATL